MSRMKFDSSNKKQVTLSKNQTRYAKWETKYKKEEKIKKQAENEKKYRVIIKFTLDEIINRQIPRITKREILSIISDVLNKTEHYSKRFGRRSK